MNVRRLGERIRELRIQKGLSQKVLSDGVCSESYISQIERGVFTGEIAAEKLSGLSVKLGISIHELLDTIETDDLENDILLDIAKVSIQRGDY